MKTKKTVIKKKLRRPGFEPIIYVSVAMLTTHKTTMESTTKLSYQWISRCLFTVIARNIPIAHDPSRKTIYSVLVL